MRGSKLRYCYSNCLLLAELTTQQRAAIAVETGDRADISVNHFIVDDKNLYFGVAADAAAQAVIHPAPQSVNNAFRSSDDVVADGEYKMVCWHSGSVQRGRRSDGSFAYPSDLQN